MGNLLTLKRLSLTTCLLFVFLVHETLAKADRLRCMWRQDPATSMVIAWDQVSGQNPEICFGKFDGGLNTDLYPNCKSNPIYVPFKGMNNYFARLENLEPDTEYFFVIVDSEGVSRKYSFKTAPNDPRKRLSFIAGGDSRNYREARVRANQLVAKLRPDFVLFGGDMTGGDTDREWKNWFADWQHTISPEGRLTPIVTARGNHEYSNATISKLFDTPNEQIYYSLRFGGDLLEVFTLNSLIASGGDQKLWLEKRLSQSKQNMMWQVAQYHFAIRPHTQKKRERNNQLENWGKLFFQYGMDLVFESDAHVVKTTWPVRPFKGPGSEEGFIRDDVDGTVYVGEGCWGAPLRRNNDDKSWTRGSGSFNQFKWVFVDQFGFEVRTVKTDNAEAVAFSEQNNRFQPPHGLELWDPPSGKVIYIPSTFNLMSDAKSVFTHHGRKEDASIAAATVVSTGDQKLEFTWSMGPGPFSSEGSFLIRSEKSSGQLSTIARVKPDEASKKFKILLSQRDQDEKYSLVYVKPGKKSKVFPFQELSPFRENVLLSKNDKQISPDPKSGFLRVRYSLDKASDVNIKLLQKSGEGKALLTSRYQNQRQGRYLKSIDMNDYPDGSYQLVIRVDEEVLEEFEILK